MLETASLFTDGGVLCRDREIWVFGRADSGKTVTVRLRDSRGNLLAEEKGTARKDRFEITLPPQRAQTGCTLTVSSEDEQVTAADIAVGDVYLAGGQSNMELELRNSLGGLGQVRDDPLLRFFNVPRKACVCAEQQQAVRETRWQPVTQETAGYNSAVASIFGDLIRKKHPEIPVGIIGCYWGGTSVTCWMDRETLGSLSEGIRYRREYEALCAGKTMEQYLTEEAAFLRSPGIYFPPFDPAASQDTGIFTPEGSSANREHLMSYFLVIEVDAIRKSMESLRYLARHDQLTGLYNRHMMAEIINDDPSIVIILDIDNFKSINDTYGHSAGDEALCTMAGRLEAVFWRRERDQIFRLGGDEFLVVMKGASEEEAVRCLRLICEPVVFTTSDDQLISYSVSAGYIPCNGDFKASMKAADDALYAAKKAGKSGFVRAE